MSTLYDRFTPTEKRVLSYLMNYGMRNKEIANEMHTTEATVKNYMSHIYDKTGMSNIRELFVLFMNKPDLLEEVKNGK